MRRDVVKFLTFFTVLLGLFSSCVPQTSTRSGRTSSGAAAVDTSSTPAAPDFSETESEGSLFWFNGTEVPGTITLNENSLSVLYLRGDELHTFLNSNDNFQNTYCMVATMGLGTTKKQFRARAVPISFHNFEKGSLERLFRVDIPDETNNTNFCSGTVPEVTTGGLIGADVTTANAAFSLEDICPTCSGIQTADNVSFYQHNTSIIGITVNERIPESLLNFSSIGLRVDVESNFTNSTQTCTNASCKAKGFNCCIEGQCVNDGQEKINASTDPDYQQALADIGINAANFVNWPHLFFVCTIPPIVEPTPTPLPDAKATADAEFQENLKRFNCLEEGKKEFPDFNGQVVCEPGFNQSSHDAIRSEVWAMCGCEADPFPTDPQDPRCPDFGLQAIRNNEGTIIEIICFNPQPQIDPTPFQNLQVSVPARSAPHRFFRSDTGVAVDDIETYIQEGNTAEAEGTPFSYLDEKGKSGPQNGTFNMNSIMGQFSLQLNRARPAKVVNIEFDQTLVISAIQGFFTPCPDCASDSWFSTFKPHPSSQNGNGLTSVGHTTSRQEFSNNISFGNYEDTVFGRACWVPPTMIPLTHKPNADVVTQRTNRLKAQAAFYINGYQKDWYGFNKGALIGSFDGVSWFAIGRGRRVTSTSNKLYLALNAPFADLTEPTDFIVSVVTDNGLSVVANFDHDPSLTKNDPEQNSGATCQENHVCNTDTDCITRLGWEYMCANVDEIRTNLPAFDLNADEKANQSITNSGIQRFIVGGIPGGNRKRCVYRGAGAVCKRDFQVGLASQKQRLFKCAPNFFCSQLANSDFNDEIVRSPDQLQVFLFGQDSDVLGRPLNYVDAKDSLDSDAISNIQSNAELYTFDTNDIGICRPGKKIESITSANITEMHKQEDSGKRTDYISQVSSCDSEETGSSRIITCPVIAEVDNGTTQKGDYIFLNTDTALSHEQNACGGESKKPVTGGFDFPFGNIELEAIRSLGSIVSPALTKDACFRRAGSVCHTDLDCSPNILHSEQAVFFGNDFFGGTDAEKQFWEESLVCSQAKPRPLLSDPEFDEYDMSLNHCCREVGQEITMYTQDDDGIITDVSASNTNLNVLSFPYNNPAATGRYSRYAPLSPVANGNITRPGFATSTAPVREAPAIDTGGTPKEFQWKTLNDTATRTCCGGGWIRKFSDGTTDWSKNNRLNLDVSNFSCLNYRSEIPFVNTVEVDSDNYGRDLDNLCTAPADGGCIQRGFLDPSGFNVVNPSEPLYSVGVLDTSPTELPQTGSPLKQAMNEFVPYQPIPYPNIVPIDATDLDGPYNYFKSGTNWTGASFYLPIYIGGHVFIPGTQPTEIAFVNMVYFDASGNQIGFEDVTANINIACLIAANPVVNLSEKEWCLTQDITGLFDVFHARGDFRVGQPGAGAAYGGIQIVFRLQNNASYCHIGAPDNVAEHPVGIGICPVGSGNSPVPNIRGINPGNDLYYLTKLGRLELNGIPQIFYEPLYCNSNREKLVPGIFNTTTDTRTDFEAATFSFGYNENINGKFLGEIYDPNNSFTDASNPQTNDRIVFRDKVELPQIFSSHKFQCCTKLGEVVSDEKNCCSGKAVTDEDGVRTCKLPVGADLNVYFNKFVSGDGVGEDQPAGGFTDDDFINETGEPKLNQNVYNKLDAMGKAYCENETVRKGAAFGFFLGEPNKGFFQQEGSLEDSKFYGIVDSNRDSDPANQTGFIEFSQGFRWDHHFYCD